MMVITDGTVRPIVNRLADAMGVILANVDKARHGIFFTRNVVGDRMQNIYKDDEIAIDICEDWEYFEVFGLTEDEQRDIEKFYCSLVNSWKDFRKYV